MTILYPFSVICGYLLGSVPFGYVLVKYLMGDGVDVRAIGSGNIGATNVGRAAGGLAAVITGLLDVAKGYAAVVLASSWTQGNLRWMSAAGFAAVLGHTFPVWLRFRGGKGVATGVGVYLMLSPYAILSSLLLWAAVVGASRYVSLGSIIAAATLPVWIWLWGHVIFAKPLSQLLGVEIFAAMACGLVIIRHRVNIRRLLQGTESRIRTSGTRPREA